MDETELETFEEHNTFVESVVERRVEPAEM
jgi:hypothetical protein